MVTTLDKTFDSLGTSMEAFGDAVTSLSNALALMTGSILAGTNVLAPTGDITTGSDVIRTTTELVEYLEEMFGVIMDLASTSKAAQEVSTLGELASAISGLMIDLRVYRETIRNLSFGRAYTYQACVRVRPSGINLGSSEKMWTRLPRAEVQWWSTVAIAVLCPYCGAVHQHAFASVYTLVIRPAGCKISRDTYACTFPFQDDNAAGSYEMDKQEQVYRSVGFAESTECTVRRISCVALRALHACGYLQLSIEARTLSGIFYYDGVEEYFDFTASDSSPTPTGGHNFVLDGRSVSGPSSCRLTVSPSKDENAGTWVQCLFRQADKHTSSLCLVANAVHRCDLKTFLRDIFGNSQPRALNPSLEQLSEATSKLRVGEEHEGPRWQEHLAKRSLIHPNSSVFGDTEPTYLFERRPGFVDIYLKVRSVAVEHDWKTVARMYRGCSLPPIDAKSGWSRNGCATTLVSGANYVSAVFTLARNIDYDLPHDVKRDQGIPGRFYASHAEKLLVVFLVSKHIFLPEEARYVDQARIRLALRDVDSCYWRSSDSSIRQPLLQMLMNAPSPGLRSAEISVSTEPCLDCKEFLRCINESFAMSIKLKYKGQELAL